MARYVVKLLNKQTFAVKVLREVYGRDKSDVEKYMNEIYKDWKVTAIKEIDE